MSPDCKGCDGDNAGVQAGKVYRIVMIEASTMLLMRMSFDRPGCVMGLYARDANYLQSMPRLADNLLLTAANRCGCAP